MTPKNLFIFSSVILLAFGLPLLFAPQAISDMYAVDKSALSGIALHVYRVYGALLIAFGIGGFASLKAGPSYARRGLLLIIVVNAFLLLILHILAIKNGVENSLAWSIVLISAVITVWAGLLLSKEKAADFK